MHIIPALPAVFWLQRNNRPVARFDSLQALVLALGINAVREHHLNALRPVWVEHWESPREVWSVCEEGVGPVSWLQVLLAHRGMVYRAPAFDAFWNGEGAVPRTGKRRGGRCCRRPKTTQELRMVSAVLYEEGEPDWRTRRKSLPTTWDDLWRDTGATRSWKKYRKTQYKAPHGHNV